MHPNYQKSDNREQLELNASRIPRFLCCPCILRKYSHKFAAYQDQACYYIGCCIFQTEFGNKAKIWYFCLIFCLAKNMQCLECAASNCWSKHTTIGLLFLFQKLCLSDMSLTVTVNPINI